MAEERWPGWGSSCDLSELLVEKGWEKEQVSRRAYLAEPLGTRPRVRHLLAMPCDSGCDLFIQSGWSDLQSGIGCLYGDDEGHVSECQLIQIKDALQVSLAVDCVKC